MLLTWGRVTPARCTRDMAVGVPVEWASGPRQLLDI
jgi:hypothetical protein